MPGQNAGRAPSRLWATGGFVGQRDDGRCAALVSRLWKGTRSAGCLFVWGDGGAGWRDGAVNPEDIH